jgi:tRNA(Ile)-lysidine synthase
MDNEIVGRVGAFIRQRQLLAVDALHLVALSGGADSVALLLILRSLGYKVEAVHCNFHLRAEESDRDERFVCRLCQKTGTPIHLTHFDTRTYADLHKVSIEMAARELRYRYFDQLRGDVGADRICVAHHRDDAVETLLMNLMRGTGVHGLTGIRAENGHVVRPLLCLSRKEIEGYLKEIGQDYVVDSTNLVADVLRNKIRLRLLPLMQDISLKAVEGIAQTMENMAEVEKIYNNAVLYVPVGKKSLYSQHPVWGKFISILELVASGIYDVPIDQHQQKEGIYTIDGVKLSVNADNTDNLPKGIYIINGQKVVIK